MGAEITNDAIPSVNEWSCEINLEAKLPLECCRIMHPLAAVSISLLLAVANLNV
jgi:hypothetical protein